MIHVDVPSDVVGTNVAGANQACESTRRWKNGRGIDVILVDRARYRLPAPVRKSRDQIREDIHTIRLLQQRAVAKGPGTAAT
jgi:hypothetical protein